MVKIVITGGPCSGKTTVIRAVQEEFPEGVIVVPEVSTLLLSGGFPVAGKDLAWNEEWQAGLQRAILPLQESLENSWALVAEQRGAVLLCDRGILDGAAYTPGGVQAFCKRFKVNKTAALRRYQTVVHLESQATANPSNYSAANNNARFEPLERAQALEYATRAAWESHPCHVFISGTGGIENKISQVIGIIRFILANQRRKE